LENEAFDVGILLCDVAGRTEIMKTSKWSLLFGALIASFALAQIYKWVDDKGGVHFGDCPPDDCIVEEVELPEGPSDEEVKAAQEKLRKTLQSRRAQESAQKKKSESDQLEDQREEKLAAERFKQCAETIYQLELLDQKRRVFKFQADGSRLYLEDEERPNEISRLTLLREEYCSTNPEARDKELERADEIRIALSRRCAVAIAKLEKWQQPGADPDEDLLERYQTIVEAHCPDMESDHLWLGDWIIVRKRR
jgi:hypothetical protein